jgi:large subunit ribosomal protein L15e
MVEKKIEKTKSLKGLYYYLKKAWKKPDKKVLRERMIEWRKSGVFTKVEKPLRLDRARALGYKDKKVLLLLE